MSLRVIYSGSSIRTLESLSAALSCDLPRIKYIASNLQDFYTPFSILKKDGSPRNILAPNNELKSLLRRINSRIFCFCSFPEYLQGSIRDRANPRDFVSNARIHVNAKTVVAADIEKFYPSISPSHVAEIFKYFFDFSKEVGDILVALTTFNGELPQGAPTSSYLANLVFYDTEYKLVSDFHRQGLTYTRLIDDITVSSETSLPPRKKAWIVNKIRGFLTAKRFKLQKKKLNISETSAAGSQVFITGLWIDRGHPRVSVKARKLIRAMVHRCKKQFDAGQATKQDFHDLYNSASGKIALLTRLGHSDGYQYRAVLNTCKPIYDQEVANKVERLCSQFIKRRGRGSEKLSYARRFHKLKYWLSILKRTERAKAVRLECGMSRFSPKYQIKSFKEVFFGYT